VSRLVAITGGASGIGAACATRFASDGASVAVLDLSSTPPVDVTDEAAVEGWFDSLDRAPDVLVNAAGTGGATRVADTPFAEWRRVLSVNLDGTFLCLRAAASRMIAEGVRGCVVNISSINEFWPLTGFGAYCASKAGVAMLTRVAALELGPHGIRVNAIAPGPIATPLSAPLRGFPGVDEETLKRTPLGEGWAPPSYVASVAAFLTSDDARWVTGRSIPVDGGDSLVGEPDFIKMIEKGMQNA
jgi:NAD(P)-dependent dehydrogenase (short-subunit alcohol dehydrogenase family)